MKKITISIVIPVFNKQDTIGRAIESVLHQSYDDFELIIINDGSTDKSLEIINNYQFDSRVKIFSIPNNGVSAARNSGVQNSSSEYICFLDADDEWCAEHLLEIFNLIQDNKTSILFSTRSKVKNSIRKNINYNYINGYFFQDYLYTNDLINSSSSCVRKKEFNEINGFPIGINRGEDIYVWFRLALMGKTSHSPRILVTIHDDSINRSANNRLKEIPYHILYFSSSEFNKNYSENIYFKAALSKSALMNGILNFSFYDNFNLTLKYLACSFKINKKIFLFVLLSFFIPIKIKKLFINYLKKINHKF